MPENPKAPSAACLARLCLFAAALVVLLAGVGSAQTATSESGLLAQKVTIQGVSRDAEESWVLVRTDFGDRFTQAGRDFPLKNGPGTLRLDGSGRLESLLIAQAGALATLLVSSDVDGLIVGIVREDGTPVLDKILVDRP